MAEPEDLIIDGAYLASRLARDAWRRYAPPPVDSAVRLVDVRGRIELFLNGLFEVPIAVHRAEPPAPVSWLGRVAGRASDSRRDAWPGTDGARIYLPPVLAVTDAVILAPYLTSFTFVIGAEMTRRIHVERAVGMLRSGQPASIGVVLNRVDFDRNKYYYSRYYGYQYKSYYGPAAS